MDSVLVTPMIVQQPEHLLRRCGTDFSIAHEQAVVILSFDLLQIVGVDKGSILGRCDITKGFSPV
jgi:hypothetical protein